MNVLWEMEIKTDKEIQERRPDIVAIDKTKRTTTTIDVAVVIGRKVKGNENEILKFQHLKI